ncbi:MAG: BlaI/MecI/CopY family transcriptional regulator [Lachnospiraceae bacterium]|jgi:predicted transcriptional regulator|nr:BlaI/MecI/CopY family transcriptional regulator [Lachnospiraceae bacterium]
MNYKKLTECEKLVMKVIWEAEEDLSMMEIRRRANEKYNSAWAPQTVSTFLERLCRKEYIKYYRKSRIFFYEVLVSYEEYKEQITKEFLEFWFHGSDGETVLKEIRKVLQDTRL